MPRVPSVGLSPTSRPQFQAPGVVSFQGTGELQQSARDIQRLGQIGSFVSAVGQEAEDKVNNARAREFANTFENGVNKALLTYEQTKGKDGVTGLEAFNKEIEEIYQGSSGMLMNDTQRQAAAPIVDRIRNRASLRSQAHYLKAAAEDEQAQNLAGQALVRDLMISAPDDPESLIAFARFNNLVSQEADALGLEGDARTVFELSKRDKLFQDVVTQSLDSEDPQKIATIKSLMESLPDGVISSTQKASLNELVQDKSMEANAFAWSSQHFANKKTYQEGLIEIDELAKTNPTLAEKYLRSLDTRFRANVNAQRDARNTALDELSTVVESGQPLSADQQQQAKDLGILYELQNLEQDVKNNRDITSPNGQTYFVQYDNRPLDLLDQFSSGPQVFKAARDAGCSTKDARDLAAQYNYAATQTEKASTTRASTGSRRARFNALSTDEGAIAEEALYTLDQKTIKERKLNAKSQNYRARVLRNHRGNSDAGKYALRMMNTAFKREVMTVANVLLDQIPEDQTVDRNELILRAARLVYQRGFMDDEKKKNRYTTEFANLPDVEEDVGQQMEEARQDLRQAEAGEAMRQRLMADPRSASVLRQAGVGVIRPQAIEDFARNMVFDRQTSVLLTDAQRTDMVGALASAKSAMPLVEASSPISEADVRARARVLNQDRIREERIQSAEETFDVERRIAGQLLEVGPDELRDDSNLPWYQSGIFSGDNRLQSIRKWNALPLIKKAREQYIREIGNDDDWEDFLMMFYPGSDAAIKGAISDRTRQRLNDAYRTRPSQEDAYPRSRFEALRLYFTEGLGDPRRGQIQR
jgi:hypothetical protein